MRGPALLILSILLALDTVASFPMFLERLPPGAKAVKCASVQAGLAGGAGAPPDPHAHHLGHAKAPLGCAIGHSGGFGGSPLNSFGKAFAKAGFVWSRALCLADSDGDGLTNGEELGDPCCEWSPASAAVVGPSVLVASHPAIRDPAPPPGLRRRADACNKDDKAGAGPDPHFLQTAVVTRDPSDPTGAAFFADFRPATPFVVPGNQTTTYGALSFNLPPGPGGDARPLSAAAYDITAIEPLLDGAADGALHHFDFALCRGLAPVPGVQAETPNAATSPVCGEAVYVWTAGGEPVHRLPAGAGLRYGRGTAGPVLSFRLGTHYHTPPLNGAGERTRRAVADRTGVRLHITPRLRDGEAALLWAGPISHGVGAVPPGRGAWYVGSTCRPQLGVPSRWAVARARLLGLPRPTGGVSVFAFLPHMHKLGRAQGVSLLRPRQAAAGEGGGSGGVAWDTVASLGAAVGYSYAATHYVALSPAVRVLPGDVLATTCVYSSLNRTEAVHGGLGSDDEMCIAFLAAHPASAAGASRHCVGVVSAGEYRPYAGLKGGGDAPDPPPALPLVDPAARPAVPADWHLELAAGRLACDPLALARTARAAASLPDPGAMLADACGADWARLAGPAALRREHGAWVAGAGPPGACSLACARSVYNWLACSRTGAGLSPAMGGLAMLAGAVEPVADLACGGHLVSGAVRPPPLLLLSAEGVGRGGLWLVGGAACAWAAVSRRRRRVQGYRGAGAASPHRA